ncbi:hypothetical protein [Vulcanococcus limneticus]|uniref:hypothetical protein n=1 Tax=Vulcanococcus limneticus TaxID=2170428 RepID=UPI00398BCCA0
MNPRRQLVVAVLGALLGGLFGVAVRQLGTGPTGRPRFESAVYTALRRHYPWIGAGAGALVGLGVAAVGQASRDRGR